MITEIVRYTFRVIGKLLYKVRVTGAENFPLKGGALLIPNHNSLLDAAIVASGEPRMIRFVIYKEVFKTPILGKFLFSLRMIPIASTRSKTELMDFYGKCCREINAGEIVCVFPEGEMPRNGFMLGFKKGFELIARQSKSPIIPFYVDNALGSPFTFKTGKSKPVKLKISPFRTPITISIGEKLPFDTSSFQIRQKLKELESEAFTYRVKNEESISYYLLFSKKSSVSYLDLAISARFLKTMKKQNLIYMDFNSDEYQFFIKIILLAGKTMITKDIANNYSDFIRIVNEKNTFIGEDLVFTTKELKNTISPVCMANGILGKLFPFTRLQGNSNLISLITKNGDYTHKNLILCVLSLDQVLAFNKNDTIGLTIQPDKPIAVVFTLLALIKGLKQINFSIENKDINKDVSIIISEKKWVEENYLFLSDGVGKIIVTDGLLSAEIKKHLSSENGIKVLEGYGDEFFPMISLNTPDFSGKDIAGKEFVQHCSREGSVGRMLPGVAIKICDENDGFVLKGEGEEGRLQIKGFGLSEKTLKEARFEKGWYVSCSNGYIDKDGFLFLKK